NVEEVFRRALEAQDAEERCAQEERQTDAPRPIGRRSITIPARSLEQEWLKQHRSEYAGDWVALEGASLLARGASARQVLDAANIKGCEQPLVVHIPSEPDLPFGGW